MILISGHDQFPEIMIENVCSNTSPTVGNSYNISKAQFLYLSNVDISNIYSHLFQDFAVTFKWTLICERQNVQKCDHYTPIPQGLHLEIISLVIFKEIKNIIVQTTIFVALSLQFSLLVQFSNSVLSNSLWPHGLQYTRLPFHQQFPGLTHTHVH